MYRSVLAMKTARFFFLFKKMYLFFVASWRKTAEKHGFHLILEIIINRIFLVWVSVSFVDLFIIFWSFCRIMTSLPVDAGIVVVADQQTSGRGKIFCFHFYWIPSHSWRCLHFSGRGGNIWESPEGCAMFSFPLIIPLSSRLGNSLSFVQHLVATAVVRAVRAMPGYEVQQKKT